MPRNIPRLTEDQIIWFENHWPLWQAQGAGAGLGLSALQVAQVRAATEEAREAQRGLDAARQAARAAFIARQAAAAAMNDLGRDAVNIIKAFIAADGDPGLWADAGLIPGATGGPGRGEGSRSPDGGLRPPFALRTELLTQGAIRLRWKARQPAAASGVLYSIRRALDGGPFTLLELVGGKEFTDETVPAGTASLGYILHARRGSAVSAASAACEVRFGSVASAENGSITSRTARAA
jgi:hypothetical protein